MGNFSESSQAGIIYTANSSFYTLEALDLVKQIGEERIVE